MKERRQYERFELRLPAAVVYSSSGKRVEEQVRLINICAGGAYFPLSQSVSLGEELELMIGAREDSPGRDSNLSDAVQDERIRIETRGIVLRSEKKPERPSGHYLAVMFVGPIRFAAGRN